MSFPSLHPDEREDFGRASEAQNCLAEATMVLAAANGEASVKISEALAQGAFVVVVTSPYYCRSTDAIAGTYRDFGGAFVSRDDADAAAAKINEQGEGELSAVVLPELPKVEHVMSPVLHEEQVPF